MPDPHSNLIDQLRAWADLDLNLLSDREREIIRQTMYAAAAALAEPKQPDESKCDCGTPSGKALGHYEDCAAVIALAAEPVVEPTEAPTCACRGQIGGIRHSEMGCGPVRATPSPTPPGVIDAFCCEGGACNPFRFCPVKGCGWIESPAPVEVKRNAKDLNVTAEVQVEPTEAPTCACCGQIVGIRHSERGCGPVRATPNPTPAPTEWEKDPFAKYDAEDEERESHRLSGLPPCDTCGTHATAQPPIPRDGYSCGHRQSWEGTAPLAAPPEPTEAPTMEEPPAVCTCGCLLDVHGLDNTNSCTFCPCKGYVDAEIHALATPSPIPADEVKP